MHIPTDASNTVKVETASNEPYIEHAWVVEENETADIVNENPIPEQVKTAEF